ncbi:methylamine dehydrogenase light chain [Azospirillum sp. ST 5-10]|uniref:methylamine dehydrogenase light chain n=1 Tax=unclassified Azospirillum TaxID=2630922 RepID=UPI003F4A3718
MINLFDAILERFDRLTERGARAMAKSNGRRSFLARTGTLMLGGAVMPLLPFDRTFGQAFAATTEPGGDEALLCEYWRYCALDGNLCSACGGSLTQCPPGAEASKVSWVGTCRNPNDGKDYLVAYNDCCGKPICDNSPFCLTSKGERPGYRMGLHNDINWCMANASKGYHCTVAVLVGLAE